MSDLTKNFKYFENNRKELIKNYRDKYVVIHNESVFGTFDSEAEAYSIATQSLKLGEFLIQQCIPEKEEKVALFHNRAIFN